VAERALWAYLYAQFPRARVDLAVDGAFIAHALEIAAADASPKGDPGPPVPF